MTQLFPDIIDIQIENGTTYVLHYILNDPSTLLPINLTGYTAHLQVRPYVGDPNVILDYSTTGGQIVLGGTAGTIDITFPPADTANSLWDEGVYDLLITAPNGTISKILKGRVLFSWTITQ